MNWKTSIPLVLAVVFGLLAAKAARDLVLRSPRSAGAAEARGPRLVVARTDLSPGTALTEKHLRIMELPADQVPDRSFRSVAEAIGRVLLRPVFKDQPIDESLLAPPGTAAGPQALVPQGMRAVTIEINEVSGVGGLVVPGSTVDVVCTIPDDGGGRPVTRTIVQNVKVLAVGQRLAAASDDGETSLAKSATLLVTPRQAEEIELATNAGRTRLALRSPLDGAENAGGGVTLSDLFGLALRPAGAPVAQVAHTPATRPSTPVIETAVALPQTRPAESVRVRTVRRHTVELISGGQVTQVEFELPSSPPDAPREENHEASTAEP